MLNPRERRLLRQAEQLERDNKLSASESVYRDLVTESPNVVDGWLGIARTTDDSTVKTTALERVIEIAPDHEVAASALQGTPLPALPPLEEEKKPLVSNLKREETYALPSEPILHDENGNEEIGLRCNKCGKLIEPKDVVPSPVGYRCKECAREIESSYFTAKSMDIVIAPLAVLPFALAAGFLAGLLNLGFFFLIIMVAFIGPAVGSFLGTIGFRVIGKRRGRYLPYAVALAVVVGAGVMMLLFGGYFIRAAYAFGAASAAFYRMK